MECEGGSEIDLVGAVERVGVGRLRGAQRSRMQAAVRFEDLGMPNRDGVAAAAPDAQPDEPRKVLAGVEAGDMLCTPRRLDAVPSSSIRNIE